MARGIPKAATVNVNLGEDLKPIIDRIAEARRVNRSWLIREIVIEWLEANHPAELAKAQAEAEPSSL